MMRHVVISVSILLVILLGAIINSRIMTELTDHALTCVESALAAEQAGDRGAALRQARVLGEFWDEQRVYLESVLLHGELDDITATILEFVSSAENDETEAFRTKGNLLRMELPHMADLERLRLSNIL